MSCRLIIISVFNRARRFVETANKDYESVVKYAKDAGLNLAAYDYTND